MSESNKVEKDELSDRYMECNVMGLLTVHSCRTNRKQSNQVWAAVAGVAKEPVNRACCARCTRQITMADTRDPGPILVEASDQIKNVKARTTLYGARAWRLGENPL